MAEIFDFYVNDNRSITFKLSEPIMLEDNGVSDWRFHIPNIVNGLDATGWAWWLVYVNAKNEKYTIPLTLEYDFDRPDAYSIATYTVDYGMSCKAGNITFSIEAIDAEVGGEILHEWHTKTYSSIKVENTLQGNQVEYAETESDIISALIIEVQNKINQLTGGATPLPVSSISDMVDTSKVYILTTDGNWYFYSGSTWVAGGQYAAGVVYSDDGEGNITVTTSEERSEGIDLVTPEMYGAVGDGTTDDVDAIQSAMDYAAANGIPFKCTSAQYAISEPLDPKRGVNGFALYDFNGAWIKVIGTCPWAIQGTVTLENLPSFTLMNINIQCSNIADGIDFSKLRRSTFENVVIRNPKTYALYSSSASGQVMFFNVRGHKSYSTPNNAYFIYTNSDAWFVGCFYQNFKYGAYVTAGNVFINNFHGYPSPYNYVGSYGISAAEEGRVTVNGFYPDSVNYCILCNNSQAKIHVSNMQNFMNVSDDLPIITQEVMEANPHTIAYTDKKTCSIVITNSVIWQSVTNGVYDDYSSMGQGWTCYGCTQRHVVSSRKPKSIPQLYDSLNANVVLDQFAHWNGVTTLKATLNSQNIDQFILRAGIPYAVASNRKYSIPGATDGRYLAIEDDVDDSRYAIRVRNRQNAQIGAVIDVSFPV